MSGQGTLHFRSYFQGRKIVQKNYVKFTESALDVICLFKKRLLLDKIFWDLNLQISDPGMVKLRWYINGALRLAERTSISQPIGVIIIPISKKVMNDLRTLKVKNL